MISMTYNERFNIVEVIFKGAVALADVLIFVENIGENKHLYPKCKILTDATNACYTFSIEELSIISKKVKKNTENFDSLKVAFIHNNSKDTAISIIFADEYTAKNHSHKTFSTRESGLKWLLSDS